MEKIIEVKNKYICKKCNKFIASFKEDGYIEINPKSKKISTNGSEFKIICQCGEVHRIKI